MEKESHPLNTKTLRAGIFNGERQHFGKFRRRKKHKFAKEKKDFWFATHSVIDWKRHFMSQGREGVQLAGMGQYRKCWPQKGLELRGGTSTEQKRRRKKLGLDFRGGGKEVPL